MKAGCVGGEKLGVGRQGGMAGTGVGPDHQGLVDADHIAAVKAAWVGMMMTRSGVAHCESVARAARAIIGVAPHSGAVDH